MYKVLVLIDVQKDFVDGTLPVANAHAALDNINKLLSDESFDKIVASVDNHMNEVKYATSFEYLSIPIHCNTYDGAETCINNTYLDSIDAFFIKDSFCSQELTNYLAAICTEQFWHNEYIEITFVGLCTDICVIANAINARSTIRDGSVTVKIKANCCAGTTVENHEAALRVAKSCLIEVE